MAMFFTAIKLLKLYIIMNLPISNIAKKCLRSGLSISLASDGRWLSEYKNTVGITQKIGAYPDEKTALRAGVLWCGGFRFDEMCAEYARECTLEVIAKKYGCNKNIARECVVFGGGIIRPRVPNPANRKGKKFPESGSLRRLHQGIIHQNRNNKKLNSAGLALLKKPTSKAVTRYYSSKYSVND
jgi:hypothetical protein